MACPSGPSSGPRPYSSCLFRQHDSSLLPPETGRNEIMVSLPTSATDHSLARTTSHSSHSSIHPRDKKFSGGCPKQKGPNTSNRVDAPSRCLPTNLEGLGSAHDRPLRDQSYEEATPVHDATLRSDGNSNRFHVAKLVQHGRLCFSSIRHDKECPQQVYGEQKLQNHPNSSMVATEGVVPGSSKASSGGTSSSSTQTRPIVSASGQGRHRSLHTLQLAAWKLSKD